MFYILSSSGVALPSDAGAGDLLRSFSVSFSVGVIGAGADDVGVCTIGTGGGGITGGGINGTAGFSIT